MFLLWWFNQSCKLSKYQQTKSDLEAHLAEQLEFMKLSVDSFDAGHLGEAKRLAVSTRVLLHQTAVSQCLLGQLGLRQQDFVDTAHPYNPRNLLSHHGLVGMKLGRETSYVAFLDEPPRRLVKFSDWWDSNLIIADRRGGSFTRRGLVLALSNKDGGAHVDPQLDQTYANLKLHNSMGWTVGSSGQESPLPDVELHSMRQIAHEVLATLIPNYTKHRV
jgi:hypothetical protein